MTNHEVTLESYLNGIKMCSVCNHYPLISENHTRCSDCQEIWDSPHTYEEQILKEEEEDRKL